LLSLSNHPYAGGMVECKEVLNASRALLVLELIILKGGRQATIKFGKGILP